MANDGLQREILLGPDLFARGAAAVTGGRAVRWMLGQPRQVRRSYVEAVLDRPAELSEEHAQQAWMLRQADTVRESYIAQVLERRVEKPRPQVLWMLRQSRQVRDSYVTQVIGIRPPEPPEAPAPPRGGEAPGPQPASRSRRSRSSAR